MPASEDEAEADYYGVAPANPTYVDVDPSLDPSSVPANELMLASGQTVMPAAQLQDQRTDALSNVEGADPRTGQTLAKSSSAVRWALCEIRAMHPHWSKNGKTVDAKTRVRCQGNYAPVVDVKLTCWLFAKEDKHSPLEPAGMNWDPKVVPTNWKWQTKDPLYCPKVGVHIRAGGRLFQNVAMLEMLDPGIKTPPGYDHSPWVPVTEK